MITCQHCHAQTDDGAVFCDLCGHELISTPQRGWRTPQPAVEVAMPAPVTPVSPVPPTPPPPAGRHAQGDVRAAAPQRPTPLMANAVIALRLANGQRFTLGGKSEYTIGRVGADHPRPDVDLADFYGFEAGVSREHIMIHVRADGVFVEDLESRNETVQNGYRLMPQQWYPLRDGDELRLGAIILYVSFERP